RLAVNQKVAVRLRSDTRWENDEGRMTNDYGMTTVVRGQLLMRDNGPLTTDIGDIMTKILERPTLVLKRNWQPVNVAAVAQALVLVWNESARVVDPDDYRLYTWADWSALTPRGELFIQAVRQRLRVPEVIALAGYDRLPSAAVSFSRRNIFKRDHYTC